MTATITITILKQWYQMPAELQLTDFVIKRMSLKDIETVFNTAYEEDVLEDFTRLFFDSVERIRTTATREALQQQVYKLENFKRYIGRKYNAAKTVLTKALCAAKYDELECKIQWIVTQYELHRKSKPYFIKEIHNI